MKSPLQDHNGDKSSKRIAGFVALLASLVAAFWLQNENLTDIFLLWAGVFLGITGAEKIAKEWRSPPPQ